MISVSFLGIKENLKQNIKKLEQSDCSFLHCDIMDGKFVSNETWKAEDLLFLKESKKPLDVHLMVEDVDSYITSFSKLHPEYITFHVEATSHVKEMIDKIHDLNCKAGISIKPGTPVSQIVPYLKDLDLVLVMSVEPGKGGQKFLPVANEKIKELKTYQKEYSFIIEVDGGINEETIKTCEADLFVVGSYITKEENYQKQIARLFEIKKKK